MSVSLDLIETFYAVHTDGSFSRAAKRLDLSHPTVRRHIETLEQQLSQKLFARSANGLAPTAAAISLAPLAASIVAQGAAFKRAAASEIGHGTVRVTASHVLAVYVLPKLFAALAFDLDGITIELSSSNIAQDLASREADIAIRMTPPTQLSLVARKLPEVEIGLVAQPVFATKHATTSLKDMPFIADDRAGQIVPALQAAGAETPKNIVLRTDDQVAQMAAIEAGLGAGLCQCGIAARLGLTRLRADLKGRLPCFLVMHEDQRQITPVRTVYDKLATYLPDALQVQLK